MPSFKENQTIADFQKFNYEVYRVPDDRLYSLSDLLAHQQRFAMRALKGIRKDDKEKLKKNLLISFSFLAAIANRLNINIEDEVWKRFPMLCSYCGKIPCQCKKIKPAKRKKVSINNALRPKTLAEFQEMFSKIYPQEKRTLAEEGVHLAEEVGEVNEAVQHFMGKHVLKQFNEVKLEIADLVSCIFGVANSAKIDFAKELAKIFILNCHVCHKAPCVCSFSSVAGIKT
ncbi:MAG: hypothetical protein WCT19_01365 [Candidatus Paceibacterota bacterium]|jgi:NTP pyrophosphatase (non-canonical NTP hydrolase)